MTDPDPKPVSDKKRQPRVHAPSRDLDSRGKCKAYSPRGTKCKFCGKEH